MVDGLNGGSKLEELVLEVELLFVNGVEKIDNFVL